MYLHASKVSLAIGLLAAHLTGLNLLLASPAVRHGKQELLPAVTVRLIETALPASGAAVPARATTTTASSRFGFFSEKNTASTPRSEIFSAGQNYAASPILKPSAYLPSTAMDRRPTPVSEPDIDTLQGLTTSGLPVRLRIYIDRFGRVAEVTTLEAGLLDEEFAVGLKKMFLGTAFLPGQLHGQDVASFLDIELIGQ